MQKKILEVCAGSYQDCLAADRGGAQRVELNCALSVGGLTPGIATLRRVKKETALKVICMLRPRAGGFCYDKADLTIMAEDAALLMENGADGLAFGFLKPDGGFLEDAMVKTAELVHKFGGEAVCHRAFDVSEDPFKAIETLIRCGIDRVLTSGLEPKAIDGKVCLEKLQAAYGNQIEFLAGSGVNVKNAAEIMETTGIVQLHSSCKNYRHDPTTQINRVSYAYLDEPHEMDYDVVDEAIVKKMQAIVDNYTK